MGFFFPLDYFLRSVRKNVLTLEPVILVVILLGEKILNVLINFQEEKNLKNLMEIICFIDFICFVLGTADI